MALNSRHQAISYQRQSILSLAEKAVQTRTEAQQARDILLSVLQVYEAKDAAARAAQYAYVEVLEARLRLRDLPPAA